MKRLLALCLVVAACGGGGSQLTALAEDTCGKLDGAIMLQAGGILTSATREARLLGHTTGEFGDAMREVCPGLMAALAEWNAEQTARDNLINEVTVQLDGCRHDGAAGTVVNKSNRTVDVYVEVQFLDDEGVLINTGLGSVRGLRAGQAGEWNAHFIGRDYARCRASIDSVFES